MKSRYKRMAVAAAAVSGFTGCAGKLEKQMDRLLNDRKVVSVQTEKVLRARAARVIANNTDGCDRHCRIRRTINFRAEKPKQSQNAAALRRAFDKAKPYPGMKSAMPRLKSFIEAEGQDPMGTHLTDLKSERAPSWHPLKAWDELGSRKRLPKGL
jgi:hypothetical protein